jgi:hypothetical protein
VGALTQERTARRSGLREAYSSTPREGRPLVAPDVVDDGARLASFADASLDFVIANHVEDPNRRTRTPATRTQA